MAQMTWRVSDEVLAKVRRQAEEHGRSLNEWVTTVLSAASDPSSAGTLVEQLRERLAHAGVLETVVETPGAAPDPALVAAARARAGAGTPLAELVTQARG